MGNKAHNRRINNICVLLILLIVLEMCLMLYYMLFLPRRGEEIIFLGMTVLDCTLGALVILSVYGINNGRKLAWYTAVILCICSVISYLWLCCYLINFAISAIVALSAVLLLFDKELRGHCSVGRCCKA